MKFSNTYIILLLIFLAGCKQIPKTKHLQWTPKFGVEVHNDSVHIKLHNPIKCPIRIIAKSPIEYLQKNIDQDFSLILEPSGSISYSYWTDKSKKEIGITLTAVLGNPEDEVLLKKLELPFLEGKTYEIIQGYNGKFSHRSEYSKFALDFNLAENDTICSAADGFVVGVIEEY